MRSHMERKEYARDQILKVLKSLEILTVAIDQIGHTYVDDVSQGLALRKFINDMGFFEQLTEARSILSEKFSSDVGEDDLSELEREFVNLTYWALPAQSGLKTPNPEQDC